MKWAVKLQKETDLMNMDPTNDLPLKSYLLGDLNPNEQQRLEQRLMIDSAAFEELRWIEDELIDDYLEGSLSGSEKEKFENFFLSTPERRQKLSFAESLKRYVAVHSSKENRWSIWWNSSKALWRSQNPVYRWCLAASLLLIIAGGSWSIAQISRLQKALEQGGSRASQMQLMEMQDRYSQMSMALQREQSRLRLLEQEAANLKQGVKPGNSSLLPGQLQTTLIAVTLPPGQLRDFGGSQRISIPAGTDLAQFDLKMEPEDYSQYRAILQNVDQDKIWTQISPMTESGMQGQFLRLIVPAKLLKPGDYVLKLSGVTAAGDFEDIGNYYFRVTAR